MITLLEGVIAESMPPWNPAQFVRSSAEGSWWKGTTADNKWVSHLGTTPVTANGDLVGNWLDELGNRALIQSVSNNKPRWNSANGSVEFFEQSNNQKSLTHTLLSSIPLTQDVTIMATVAVIGGGLNNGGAVRGTLGLGTNTLSTNLNHVVLTPRQDQATDRALASLSARGEDPPHNSLTTNNQSDSFATFSFHRSAAHSGKLINFHKNGILVAAGPTIQAGLNNNLTQIFIVGSSTPGIALHVKDLVIAFKKPRPSDYTGYHQYAQTL